MELNRFGQALLLLFINLENQGLAFFFLLFFFQVTVLICNCIFGFLFDYRLGLLQKENFCRTVYLNIYVAVCFEPNRRVGICVLELQSGH